MSTPAYLIGNATRTPELRQTNDGTPVTSLSIAVNSRRQVDGEWVDGPTTYFDVSVYGDLAANVCRSVTKGTRLVVVGQFRTRTWRDESGEHSRLEVVADEVGPSLRWATADVTKVARS